MNIDDGLGQRLVVGSNGLLFESVNSALFTFDPVSNKISLKNVDPFKSISLDVAGDINMRICENGVDNGQDTSLGNIIMELRKRIVNLENELLETKKILDSVYYAPGMPGYILSREHFENC